jgi:hypothetical protein
LLFDWNGASPDALDLLHQIGSADLRVFTGDGSGGVLHAKVWLVETGRRYVAAVGSANITREALSANEEATTLIQGRAGDRAFDELAGWFDRLWQDQARARPWSADLRKDLARYRRVRGAQAGFAPEAPEALHPYALGAAFARVSPSATPREVRVVYRARPSVRSPAGGQEDQGGLLRRDIGAVAGLLASVSRVHRVRVRLDEAGAGQVHVVMSGGGGVGDALHGIATRPERRAALLRSLRSASEMEVRAFLQGMADVCGAVTHGTAGDVIFYSARGIGASRGREMVQLCWLLQHRLGVPVHWVLWPQQRTHQREFQLRVRAADFAPIGLRLKYRRDWLAEAATQSQQDGGGLCPRERKDYVALCAASGCARARRVIGGGEA